MTPKNRNSILIPYETAVELVEPYGLRDVLQSLVDNKILVRFAVTEHHVAVEPNPLRSFDLAMYFAEFTGGFVTTPRRRSRQR